MSKKKASDDNFNNRPLKMNRDLLLEGGSSEGEEGDSED